MRGHLGFDGRTNKIMKLPQDLRVRVLFWLVIIVIYEVMEFRARTRRLRPRLVN
jgi:hypothetical protein